MKLTKRLHAIAQKVEKNSIVADIGTDHGYIPKYLIDNEISKMVIATDISEGSLSKTTSYVEEETLSDFIMPRLGSGLSTIKPFEVDTVIIAGMGGVLISEILEADRKKASTFVRFILQPMVGSIELRKYLISSGFKILGEDLVKEDGRYYEIILAENGVQKFEKEMDYEISPILISNQHPIWREFVEWKLATVESISRDLESQTSDKSVSRNQELKEVIRQYGEVLGS